MKSILCGAVVVALFPILQASAQTHPRQLDVSELILRMAVERESLVQFAVDCRVRGTLGSPYQSSSRNAEPIEESQFKFEYSRIEKHRVYVFRPVLKTGSSAWNIVGVSRDCSFARSGQNLVVRNWSELMPSAQQSGVLPRFFDVRATGLGACGDLLRASGFEKICSNLLNMGIGSKKAKLTDDGLYEFKDKEIGIEFVIDPDRGYWPTKFIFAPPSSESKTEWSVELAKVLGHYVPAKSEIVCSKKGSDDATIEFEFDWETINEAFPTGMESVERLAKQYELPVIDRRK